MRIGVSSRAYTDLQTIFLYISESDPSAAQRVIADINRRFYSLANFPHLGRPWPDAESAMRRLVAGGHLIFYRVESQRLLILRALDGRMDVETELLK